MSMQTKRIPSGEQTYVQDLPGDLDIDEVLMIPNLILTEICLSLIRIPTHTVLVYFNDIFVVCFADNESLTVSYTDSTKNVSTCF